MPCPLNRRWNDRISLGQYRIVFQAEVYAIMAYVVENLAKNYRNRNIYIFCHTQAAIKALSNHQITTKLVWDLYQSLIQLSKTQQSSVNVAARP
jgi:hypothetical protein